MASRCRSWPSCWRELGHALFPGPLLPDGAGLGCPGPGLAWAGDGAGGMARGPGRRDDHGRRGVGRGGRPWQPGRGRGARPGGLRAPGARAAHRPPRSHPAGLRHRHRLAPARPGGAGRRGHRRGAARARRHPCPGAADDRQRRAGHGAPARAGDGVGRRRARPGPDAGGGRAPGSPAGAWRRRRTTPRCASSSAAPSASSRRSSTRWPTCWSRWSRARRWPGTPRPPGARTTGSPTDDDPGPPPERASPGR